MKQYEAHMTLFRKNLVPFNVFIEGSRTKVTDAINELMKQNEDIHNIQIVIKEKE